MGAIQKYPFKNCFGSRCGNTLKNHRINNVPIEFLSIFEKYHKFSFLIYLVQLEKYDFLYYFCELPIIHQGLKYLSNIFLVIMMYYHQFMISKPRHTHPISRRSQILNASNFQMHPIPHCIQFPNASIDIAYYKYTQTYYKY